MDLDTTLQSLAVDPSAAPDAAELALALSRDEYPGLDTEAYLNELAGMAKEARSYLCGDLENRVRGLCRYLFHDQGFRGDQKNYYNPHNSYLNDVLDRRTGIPITLSLVAMAVGLRAGLDVVGVGLPGHFVAKAMADGDEVLFDPFHGGRILTASDCQRLVEQSAGIPFEANARTLRAVPLRVLIERMLTNLKGVYVAGEDLERAIRVMRRLCQIAPGNAIHRRDLGATLLRMGRAGQAIDHLAAYLSASPSSGDAPAVRDLLTQAQSIVARWN
jgi:regulator of sirC expression with transglutaminase-like and TPR domain